MTRTRHVHFCACGAELVCGYDRCSVTSEPFQCEACVMAELDTHISELETQQPPQEMPSADDRQGK